MDLFYNSTFLQLNPSRKICTKILVQAQKCFIVSIFSQFYNSIQIFIELIILFNYIFQAKNRNSLKTIITIFYML